MYNEKCYAIALSVISSPASNCLWGNLNHRSAADIYNEISYKKNMKTQDFIAKKYSYDPLMAAKNIYEIAELESIKIIDFWSEEYPKILKEIHRPPIVIYWKGDLVNRKMVAIVGTRKSDKRSESNAKRIAQDLSTAGFSIVSGMAIGIDREAHLGALEMNQSTVGVLANGIDIIYPSVNRDLYKKIDSSNCSALLSEYPPGIFAGKWTFVRRNRIISGLSLGAVVVKAGLKSGALITARYAAEQGREVFACPGYSFDEGYSGCNSLIKNGAVLVSNTDDIINELPDYKNRKLLFASEIMDKVKQETEINSGIQLEINDFNRDSLEWKILETLTLCEDDIDSIVRKLDISPNEINEAIMTLELSGRILRNGNILSRI